MVIKLIIYLNPNLLGNLTENSLVGDVLDAVPQPGREGGDEYVQVKEKAEPSGGLVLWHRGNDRYVYLGIACVP